MPLDWWPPLHIVHTAHTHAIDRWPLSQQRAPRTQYTPFYFHTCCFHHRSTRVFGRRVHFLFMLVALPSSQKAKCDWSSPYIYIYTFEVCNVQWKRIIFGVIGMLRMPCNGNDAIAWSECLHACVCVWNPRKQQTVFSVVASNWHWSIAFPICTSQRLQFHVPSFADAVDNKTNRSLHLLPVIERRVTWIFFHQQFFFLVVRGVNAVDVLSCDYHVTITLIRAMMRWN